MTLFYRPWVNDPDNEPIMTDDEIERACRAVAAWMRSRGESSDLGNEDGDPRRPLWGSQLEPG
jgi:hypothetical protein